MIYEEELNLSKMAARTKKIEYEVDENGCWICTSHSRNTSGYPTIRRNEVSTLMNRYIYQLENGSIPEGLHVLHKCDNPACINSSHLFLGTHKDNMMDMSSKGRNGYPSKITQEQADEIRNDNRSIKEIREYYGLSDSQVRRIKKGTRWKKVTEEEGG